MTTTLNRKDIEELLPWYAAGTLEAAETAAVEAALKTDADLMRQLELVREENHETILSNEAVAGPNPRVLETLFAKIAEEPARKPTFANKLLRFDLGGWLAEAFAPRTLGWASAAAALVIVAQAGILVSDKLGDKAATFGTASHGEAQTAQAGSFLLVAFQPGASAEAVASLLQQSKASIVDGPRPGGIYRIRIGGADLPKAEAERIAAALKAQGTVIRFVMPSN